MVKKLTLYSHFIQKTMAVAIYPVFEDWFYRNICYPLNSKVLQKISETFIITVSTITAVSSETISQPVFLLVLSVLSVEEGVIAFYNACFVGYWFYAEI